MTTINISPNNNKHKQTITRQDQTPKSEQILQQKAYYKTKKIKQNF